ncbi:MAG TPA: hypothetical protein VIY27_02100 [Myxococcota bacterium]
MDEALVDDEVDYGDLPPSIEVDEVVLLYRHLLAHLGIGRLEQCIGEGAHGAVYRVERDGRVSAVKLTTDADEAIASAHLVRKPCPNVVRVYRVAALPDTVLEEDLAQWFVIERELLDLPAERDAKILYAIWQLYEDDERLMVPTGGRMLDRWRERLRDMLPTTEIKRAIWILQHVGAGARELAELGLEWSDLHDQNVMRRPGSHYVIADPGPGVMTGWRQNRPIRIPAIRTSWRPGAAIDATS